MSYVKFEKLNLKTHPEFNEHWVQDRIAEDPSILGLGDIILKDKERSQPRAGRLDLLLQEADGNRRYEVEVQLGFTDESHIIRTIEYWDIERKRYPQYEHTAVIVAEDITSRFLNVIGLFNGTIPLIAIQMNALKTGDNVGLVFTTVLDQVSLGLVDEDEEVQETTDRSFWEKRATKKTVAVVDEFLEIVRKFDTTLELKYNKFYIGLARNGQPDNFAIFRPKKTGSAWNCVSNERTELRSVWKPPALTSWTTTNAGAATASVSLQVTSQSIRTFCQRCLKKPIKPQINKLSEVVVSLVIVPTCRTPSAC